MKKRLAMICAAVFLCFSAGCGAGGNSASENGAEAEEPPAVTQEEDTLDTAEQAEDNGELSDSMESAASEESGADMPEGSSTDTPEETEQAGSHILVAYFSATGTTRGVAEALASALNADLYEIIPEEPYTAEDLNYNDRTTRATVEQNTPDVRPAIAGNVENMGQYDTVFLGYPIWWGDAPRIVSTFVESYTFDGKTAIPFCTSGGSGIAASERTLREQADGGEWLSGRRFSGGVSAEELIDWAAGLGAAPQD